MRIKDGKLLYHLTTLDVFESIVANGLLSRDALNRQNIDFVDTANHEILEGRERLGLSDYVPFHFHIHTAYDTFVKNNHNDKNFIYLRLSREYARNNNFEILPIHPTSTEQPEIYSYDDGFDKIDWKVMEMTKDEFENDDDKRYHRQVRMAECLSPAPVPITDFQSIAVPDEKSKKKVLAILDKYNIKVNPPYINIDNKSF